MTELHHSMTRVASEAMLYNWKHQIWENQVVSEKVFLTKSSSYFPSPDSSFYDPYNELMIAMEFKPPTETKRGILTGLGQIVSYLDQHSISYLVIPDEVEGFGIGDFIKKIFEATSLNQKLPIGLMTYSNGSPDTLQIIMEVMTRPESIIKKNIHGENRYWAKWVDSPPHLTWLLLDIAFNLDEKGDRKKKVWAKFFDEYYYPIANRNILELFESPITLWDGSRMTPYSRIIKELKKKVNNDNITLEKAMEILNEQTDHEYVGDNLYNSYRKNYYPLLDHLGLWDDNCYLTEEGYELHKVGKLHGATSKTFRDYFAKMILITGKHLDLILDLENSTRNHEELSTSKEARVHAYSYLESLGLVKQNPNRSIRGDKKYFQNEFQLWGHLGIVRKGLDNAYFTPKKGFNFDWKELIRIIS